MARRKITRWKPSLPPARKYKKENLKELLRTSQFIYQIGEYDALRKQNRKVPLNDISSPVFQQKLAYLKKCFQKFKKATNGKGRGIAAVQVGIPERFFLLYTPNSQKKYHFFINPKITRRATEQYQYPEACMSCNSLAVRIIRPAWVEVEYYDEHGKKQRWEIKANTQEGKMYNRVLQHELDHLDGIINIDKVQSKELVFETGTRYYEKARFTKVQKTAAKKKSTL